MGKIKNMGRKPCIYKATSKTTGKSYIGQSRYGLKHRQNQHYNRAFKKNGKTKFAIALRELGKDDFIWETLFIVFEDLDKYSLQKILNQKEKEFVIKFNSFYGGYNMDSGGNGGVRYKYKTLEEKEIFKRVGMRERRANRRDEVNAQMRLRRKNKPEFKQQRREYREQKEFDNPELRDDRLARHKEYMKNNQQKRRLAKIEKIGYEAYRAEYNNRRNKRKQQDREK